MSWIDVRHSARQLRRMPGFTLVVIATMALVIAANTTIFSLMNATILRRVHTHEPHRLVAITPTDTRTGTPGLLYQGTFEAFRDEQRSFSALAMYSAGFFRSESANATFDLAIDGVTPEDFEVMRPRLVTGRLLSALDETTVPPGIVISERVWQRVFGGDPKTIGETIRINAEPAVVVGVIGAEFDGLHKHYVRGLFTLEQWLDNALLQERLIAGVSTFAASLALLLACLGVYGALAYAVVSRMREIGVRMALGATREAVMQMIVRDGLAVVVPGVLLGIPSALAAATLVRAQLYGIAPTDLRTVIGAAILFLVTGLLAAWLPARRASRTDPCEALRHE